MEKAVCDLGSSINTMALSTFERMQALKLKPAQIKVGLANGRSLAPYGMVEDIPLKVRNFTLKKIVVQIAHLFKEILAMELYHLSESLF